MTVKKFFEAFWAGAQLKFQRWWPALRYVLAAGVPAGIGLVITFRVIEHDTLALAISALIGLFGALTLRIFDRCKKVVEYAEKHDVDMKTAWKRAFPDDDDDY